MAITQADLQSFQQYASARLLNGGNLLEMDDLHEEWKHQIPDPDRAHGDLLAIRAALRDMENGDHGRPVNEVICDVRKKIKTSE